MKKIALTSLVLFALPLVAAAQTLEPLRQLIRSVGVIVAMLVPILIAIAIVVFFWGLIRYIWKRDDDSRSIMWWGLIALFIMVSFWGIIRLAQSALGIPNVPVIPAPGVPRP